MTQPFKMIVRPAKPQVSLVQFDQSNQMPRLIPVFVGCEPNLLF